jgi:hypothetical protein
MSESPTRSGPPRRDPFAPTLPLLLTRPPHGDPAAPPSSSRPAMATASVRSSASRSRATRTSSSAAARNSPTAAAAAASAASTPLRCVCLGPSLPLLCSHTNMLVAAGSLGSSAPVSSRLLRGRECPAHSRGRVVPDAKGYMRRRRHPLRTLLMPVTFLAPGALHRARTCGRPGRPHQDDRPPHHG